MKEQRSEDGAGASGRPDFLAGLLLGGLVGLAVGGLGGAAAMWLMAPRSGKQTRSQMQKRGAKLRNQAVEGVEEAVTEVGDKVQQFTDSVQKGVGDLQQHAQDMLGEGKK